jgi:hypothetical protein
LTPGEEQPFRKWLNQTDRDFLTLQAEIANDLTPKQMAGKLGNL